MELLVSVAEFFSDPDRWVGPDGIPNRVIEHVSLSAAAITSAMVLALPVGILVGHTGRGGIVAIGVANLGRAVPSYALLLVFVPIFGLGFASAFPALVLLAIPPILVNTYAGMREVDRDMVEAGRGMGMTEFQLVARVEVPTAAPVVIAGIRTAAVQVVATTTLAALVAGGALGRYLVDGIALQQQDRLVAGALLVSLLALATERALTLAERSLGGRRDRGRPLSAPGAAELPATTEPPGAALRR